MFYFMVKRLFLAFAILVTSAKGFAKSPECPNNLEKVLACIITNAGYHDPYGVICKSSLSKTGYLEFAINSHYKSPMVGRETQVEEKEDQIIVTNTVDNKLRTLIVKKEDKPANGYMVSSKNNGLHFNCEITPQR